MELTRRRFLGSLGAAGVAFGTRAAFEQSAIADALVPQSLHRTAGYYAKKINLLEDGGFLGDAWGWQFTGGASVLRSGGPGKLGAIRVHTNSGDYARFLVLGPVAGKTYTLTGWVKTENVIASEAGAGAYFAASQFEFQGRPTEFTVDGKQATEIRYGNFTGTNSWRRFLQSVKCLETTAWFEVVAGIYRAAGEAWFSGLTFVESEAGADLEETISLAEAAELAQQEMLMQAGRRRPRAAVFEEAGLPVRGAKTDPKYLAKLLTATHDVEFLNAAQITDPTKLNRKYFDLLVLSYGETFPLPAKKNVQDFLADGGDLFSTGGYAFESPVIPRGNGWVFVDKTLTHPGLTQNLLPAFTATSSGWKASDAKYCTLVEDGSVARVEVSAPLRGKHAQWTYEMPAKGDGEQYYFSAQLRTTLIQPAPNGSATLGVEQLDANNEPAYAARLYFEELREDTPWHSIERLFYLVPDCAKLRVRITLSSATGTIEARDLRLEKRPDAVRINTALGWPEDSLTVTRQQLGVFDADYRLKRVTALRTWSDIDSQPVETQLAAEGYAASGVVGMNNARWKPVLEGIDASGRKRGAAGAVMHHYNGEYVRSSWAFFGIDTHDIFAPECAAGLAALKLAVRALTLKCFLHSIETNYATYCNGEPVRLRAQLSNYGLNPASLKATIRVLDGDTAAFTTQRDLSPTPGQTLIIEETWKPPKFDAAHYRVVIDLREGGEIVDSIESGFRVWKPETLSSGMPIKFRDNYFHVDGQSVFLQGTDDYLHTFIDQNENPQTWLADAQGCRDSAIDVYENLMGLRGPQHRPTETWWRWVDAMLLNTQEVGGIFFPGMLVFSNTAVSDPDLADQKAYVKAFAARYGRAAGIMYYLNGDLELHDPNLPDLQRLYNQFLLERYGSDEALRKAWTISPPEAMLGRLKIHRGSQDWRDVRTVDDFHFRTFLVRRWLNALHDSIREVDEQHPVTAEFYQEPVSGIDLLTALGKLELANFGYFHEKDSDYYRFPQVCRFLDQSMRGKGINIGEFGVKTHPAWKDTGYYIEARTENYEHQYFLSLTHYGFALGASKMQNWCWKYPADLPFEWGINYPNELVPRDVRAYYRNSGLLFRSLHPKYEAPETVMLLASDNRMGGQGMRVVEGQLNAIRLLLDANVRFGTLTDEFLAELPAGVKTILYPLAYCPSDAIVEQLKSFVEHGGQLYVSGDISYDSLRQRTQTKRLNELCGVEFISEHYPNIQYEAAAITTAPTTGNGGPWPEYEAAPTMIVRPAGAKVLLADVDGNPVVTEFAHGKGKVIFSADPIEFHADAQYQSYGHQFYTALLGRLSLSGEALEPYDAEVHCFIVPSQDKRQIKLLVNYGAKTQEVSLDSADGNVRLSLGMHLPGVVVSAAGRGIEAIESSGNVFENEQPLITSNLHLMAISFGQATIATAPRLLLLPMATGNVTVHTSHNFSKPVLLMGEIVDGRWKTYSKSPVTLKDGKISIAMNDQYALSMLLLCDESDSDATITRMEIWMREPWKL